MIVTRDLLTECSVRTSQRTAAPPDHDRIELGDNDLRVRRQRHQAPLSGDSHAQAADEHARLRARRRLFRGKLAERDLERFAVLFISTRLLTMIRKSRLASLAQFERTVHGFDRFYCFPRLRREPPYV
jgi:hypothetical protein